MSENKSMWERVKGVFATKERQDDYRSETPVTSLLANLGSLLRSNTSNLKDTERYTGIVHSAVSVVADKFVATPVALFEKRGDEIIPRPEHPAALLLNQPNPFMTGLDLKDNWASFYKINGNVFWAFVRVEETNQDFLLPLPPYKMKVTPNKAGTDIALYTFNTGRGKVHFKPEQIIHSKTFNPENAFVGMGTIQAAAMDIDNLLYATLWSKKFYENSARPDTVVIADSKVTITPAQVEQFNADFNTKFQGADKSHKAMLLQGLVKDIKTLNPTQKEMDFIETKRLTRDDILAIFRVPKASLGLVDDVNRANAEASMVVLAENTVKPLLMRYVDMLNNKYLKRFKDSDNLFFKAEDPVPSNRELVLKEQTELTKAGVLTINEVRAERGLTEIEGGDVPYLPQGLIPIGTTTVPETNGDKIMKVFKDKNMAFEVKGAIKVKQVDEDMVKHEKVIDKASITLFDQMEAEILANLPKAIKEFVVDKAIQQNKLLDTVANTALWFKTLLPFIQDIYQEQGDKALAFLGVGQQFDIDDPLIAKQIDTQMRRLSKSVVRETIVKVSKQLNQGIAKGESITQLRKRIMNSFKTLTPFRANLIARTETLNAANGAQLSAWKQSGVVVEKIWYTAQDDRVCPYCRPLHGKTVGIETNFFKKGASFLGEAKRPLPINYRDIAEPPLHPQCRCTLIPVVKSKSTNPVVKVNVDADVKKIVAGAMEKYKKSELAELRGDVQKTIKEVRETDPAGTEA